MEGLRADVEKWVCCLPRAVARVLALSLKDASDFSTLGDVSDALSEKRAAVRIREVAYSFCNRSPK